MNKVFILALALLGSFNAHAYGKCRKEFKIEKESVYDCSDSLNASLELHTKLVTCNGRSFVELELNNISFHQPNRLITGTSGMFPLNQTVTEFPSPMELPRVQIGTTSSFNGNVSLFVTENNTKVLMIASLSEQGSKVLECSIK